MLQIVWMRIFSFVLGASLVGAAQKKVSCPDGDHIQIDVKQLAIQYDGSSFAGTLSSLNALAIHLEAAPRELQEAAVATQQWDEFLKGLAAGYNSCAITRQQYADGLRSIYPRLKEDAAGLEQIRKIVSDGQKADEKRLRGLVASYYSNLRSLVQISGKEILLQKIEALSDQFAIGQAQMLQQQRADTAKISEQQKTGEEAILAKLNELEQRDTKAPLPTPAEVRKEVSEIRKGLLAKADEAETAYDKGYELLKRYRFQDAIPYLSQALAAVPLPHFYWVLGRAYREVGNLKEAEHTLQLGLASVAEKDDKRQEASLCRELAIVLFAGGDLDGALSRVQQAMKIDEKAGVESRSVADDENTVGEILEDKGDLDGALIHTRRALAIAEKLNGESDLSVAIYANNTGMILKEKGDLNGAMDSVVKALKVGETVCGQESPEVAEWLSNIGLILFDKGDLEGALYYARRASKILETIFGPDHPQVATSANNVGEILLEEGDLDGALESTERALKIGEKFDGDNSPNMAIWMNNLGNILREKGDLEGALDSTNRALKIAENLYGEDNPYVATCINNIAQIMKERGDLSGALSYAQRALRIGEKLYGKDGANPNLAVWANNVGVILEVSGRLEEAQVYVLRALNIDEKLYGKESPRTAIVESNVGDILSEEGDLDGALRYSERAFKILETSYGLDNPNTKKVADRIERIRAAKVRSPRDFVH